MNRKYTLALVLTMLLLAVFAVSCASDASANNCNSLDAATSLINETDGYCFSLPEGFESTNLTGGLVTIAPREDSALAEAQVVAEIGQPVTPQLTIINRGSANGRSAADLAQEQFAQYANSSLEMKWGTVLLDGEEAVTIESRPGLLLTRKAFVVHNDNAFELTLSPLDENMPAKAEAAEALWQDVVQNFSFYAP
jgi:hypothetical protein